MKEKEDQLFALHQEEIAKINEDHISAANVMIKEFEAAREFLKKQIAKQNQQLSRLEILIF